MEKNVKLNKAGFLESKEERQCTNCKKMFKRTKTDTMKICKKCNCARMKCLSAEYKMRNRAQQRAKKENIYFDIEKSDIIIPEICPVLNKPLVVNAGSPGGSKYSPSLDKIIPEMGYTKGNIMVMSLLANQMKANATPEELILFAEWVLKTYKNIE